MQGRVRIFQGLIWEAHAINGGQGGPGTSGPEIAK